MQLPLLATNYDDSDSQEYQGKSYSSNTICSSAFSCSSPSRGSHYEWESEHFGPFPKYPKHSIKKEFVRGLGF